MDLGTVEAKLRNGDYPNAYTFGLDVKKIWSNSYLFNQRGTQIYNMTMDIEKAFDRGFKELDASQMLNMQKNNSVRDLEKKVKELQD